MPFNVIPQRTIKSLFIFTLAITFMIAGLGFSQANRVLASGITITVNSLSDDQNTGTGTCVQSGTICLRNAIAIANSNTSSAITINFNLSGTITVGSTLTISNTNANPIKIDGTGQSIAIDGGHKSVTTGFEVFLVPANAVLSLIEITIQNAGNENGNYYPNNNILSGGAINNAGTLTLVSCILSNNWANYGGGINNDGSLLIENSTIVGNTASYNGGGIYGTGTLTINNSVFFNNSADSDGGGLYEFSTNTSQPINIVIDNTTFSGNKATTESGSNGGAIGVGPNVILTMTNSTLSNNMSDSFASAIRISGATVTISNTTVSNNQIKSFTSGLGCTGGSIEIDSNAYVTISNSTISGNHNLSADTAICNFSSGNVVNIISTIIAGNISPSSTFIGPDVYGNFNSLGHNVIGDSTGSVGFTNGVNNDQVGSFNSPRSPGLSMLADNGGLTQTISLVLGSPAIGNGDCTGNNAANPLAPIVTTDQRGVLRNNPCDIGSYEGAIMPTSTPTSTPTLSPTSTNTPTITPTPSSTATSTSTPTNISSVTVTSFSDSIGSCPGLNCTLRTAIALANTNISSITINFGLSGTIVVGSTLIINNTSVNPITIDGAGQNVTINGSYFSSRSSVLMAANTSYITLNNLTIQNRYGLSTNGAGLYNSGVMTINNSTLSSSILYAQFKYGGAIYNDGTLTINRSTISNNLSYGPGGGIYNDRGVLTINNSTLANNSAQGGGGIMNNMGSVLIDNSTFYNNAAIYGGVGDAIINQGLGSSGSMTISNSTFSQNTDAIYNNGPLYLLSDIVTNSIDAYSHPITSLGHNLLSDGTGSAQTIWLASDQVGTLTFSINAGLGPLAVNGGATQTMALLSGSPAIRAGDCGGNTNSVPPAPPVATDQRGATRGSPCNIGSYDGVINSTNTPTFTPSNTATQTNTVTLTSTLTTTSTLTLTNTATFTDTPTNTATNTVTSTPTNTTTFAPTSTATSTATSTVTKTLTSTPIPAPIDTIGIYRAGTFYLRLHNSTGNADLTVGFTAGTKPYPIVGDWTGAGFDTVGIFDQSNGKFTLCTANVTASCANVANQKSLVLGVPNDQPLVGRWLISATNAGVGVFRPSNGLIYLKNALTTGYADYTMVLGIPGDVGVAGDWNGKGFDSPGVYRPSNSFFYLSNQVKNGSVIGDYQMQYGVGGDAPIVGDWIAQGHDGIGLFRQSNGFTYLKNALTTGYADNTFTYGIAGDIPVAGHWQAVYPPIAPPSVLIAKTAIPSQPNGSIPGDNPLGD